MPCQSKSLQLKRFDSPPEPKQLDVGILARIALFDLWSEALSISKIRILLQQVNEHLRLTSGLGLRIAF